MVRKNDKHFKQKYTDKIYGFDSFCGLPDPATDDRKDWKQTHFDKKVFYQKLTIMLN